MMWQLCFVLIGFKFCSANGINRNMETTTGEDVNLRCLGTSANDPISSITWMRSSGSILFNCDKSINPCTNINVRHTLGINITFISTVTIRNVSFVHEDVYHCVMLSPSDREICQINLTVNVPPKGLILVEKADYTIIQNQGSLTVAEGENKALVCKTNSSVKPSVHLEWVFPNELNASVEPQQNIYNGHDERLLVPTRTIHFTPTYAGGEDIVLICEVASNSTHDHIRTSVIIKNEGDLTTHRELLNRGSRESQTVAASNGDLQDFTGRGTSYTTHFGPTNQEPTEKPWYTQIRLVIPGCFGVVMLLIVLAFIIGSIRSKKRDDQALHSSGNLTYDETSHASKPTSTTGVKSLDTTFDQSDPTYAIPDVSEVPHIYMALKCTSSASTSQQVYHPTTSIEDHSDAVLYVSPTLVRKQGNTHSHLKEEPTYLNTEGASSYCEISTYIPNIVNDPTDQSDLTHVVPDVFETTHTYMAMKPILKCESRATATKQVSNPITSVHDDHDAVLNVSPTLVRKQVKAHSNLTEEPTYVNTEGASAYCEISTDRRSIVKDHTDGLDDEFTTYL